MLNSDQLFWYVVWIVLIVLFIDGTLKIMELKRNIRELKKQEKALKNGHHKGDYC